MNITQKEFNRRVNAVFAAVLGIIVGCLLAFNDAGPFTVAIATALWTAHLGYEGSS